ncbi:RbsD/FucU domain-containing protein [Yimella sp. cx-51]|uniref:RbsD/FucU domain-containing protein n=1 Tax=Yimella sp. cx-51 TaxID=2770551 RepID=UPI00165D43B4|nr:RbsD/FucU domain-containing protein [Yimella sp. cx-51]MBC9958387.1 D-ribose pyranase [Yimella sp. cx-51]QTH38208.1 D-ribose pyranase [Yimella sp. cx-51]
MADCGLPLPDGVPVVDLALVRGVPSFEQVVNALCDELVVESAVMAAEPDDTQPHVVVRSRIDAPELVSHEEFKQLSAAAKLIVRTGATTPYANVALRYKRREPTGYPRTY